jgi:hypothetical protein
MEAIVQAQADDDGVLLEARHAKERGGSGGFSPATGLKVNPELIY